MRDNQDSNASAEPGRAMEPRSQAVLAPMANSGFAIPGQDVFEDEGMDLRKYWHMLLRRRWILVAAVVLAVVSGFIDTYRTTPIYRASLLMHIEPQQQYQFLDYQQSVSVGEAKGDSAYYQTQYELLKSRDLAQRVKDELGMGTPPAQEGDKASSSGAQGLSQLLSRLLGRESGAAQDADTDTAGASKRKPVRLGALIVSPVGGSQLVRLSYDSADPREAATIVNTFATSYINMTLEHRYDAMTYAQRFLEERLQQVRANLEDSEAKLIAFAKELGIVDLEDQFGNVKESLAAMNTALAATRAEAIRAEIAAGLPEQNSGKADTMALESEVIQALKQRKVELNTQYQEKLQLYKPDYPEMVQLRMRMRMPTQVGEIDQEVDQQVNQQIDRQIAQEVDTIRASLRKERESKKLEQAAIEADMDELKEELLALQDRSTEYRTLKRDVETNRQLYDGLLQRMKEVGVVAGISPNNISVVDPALVPGAPYTPNLKNNLTKSLMFGVVLGIVLIFLVEHIDDTIKSSEDVESRLRAPVLGVIPRASAQSYDIDEQEIALLAALAPQSPVAEAVRSLRTQLLFATADGAPKVLHLTSPGPGEGKTTVSTSIAVAFAQAGSKVLLIDADLRSPSLHRVFDLANSVGLTNYLAGSIQPAEIAQPTSIARLFTITSGPLPPNPVELLSSNKMRDLVELAAQRFDYVLIDGPPVIGLADALVLANLARGTIFVLDAEATRYGPMEGAVKRLVSARANLIGAVIDRLGKVGSGYGYGYTYDYQYTYEYGRARPEGELPKHV